MREDSEIKEFRDLMQAPDTYEEGFGWGTILMAFFVGLVMAPAQLYMGLVAGQGLGGAAEWVTVILYVELSRRAFKTLKRPEIFILFYMCGAMMATGNSGLLWQQFFAQSEEVRKMGITKFIPSWYAPTDPDILAQRNFLHPAWYMPLGLMFLGQLIARFDRFGLGYVLFRLTSDVEKLPFPLAPVGAMGITALADASGQQDTWRWRTFSIGAVAGMAFGFIYLAIPNITSAFFSRPIQILPLPFVDLTSYTEKLLPAVPMLVSFNLGTFVTGMVLPFWSVVGLTIGAVLTFIANPILYNAGVLSGWEEGVGGILTIQSNTFDFYFSFGIGLSLAIAAIGFYHVFMSFKHKKAEMKESGAPKMDWSKLFQTPKGRGDFSIWIGIIIYVCSTSSYIALTYWLVNYASPVEVKFPLWLLIFYGFVYTPFISYISTRMVGLIGQPIGIPYIQQATFILSGYKGAAIWFAPIPLSDYASGASFFRQTELTGTKFSSLIKAEIVIFPILFVGTVAFSQFIISMAPVPSQMFPYANMMWELQAYSASLMYSSTLPGEAISPFYEAFRLEYLVTGFIIAMSLYLILDRFGLPIFLCYGVIGGLGSTSMETVLFMLLGSLFGRYYCRDKFGAKWPQYRIVFAAGFGAGMGLITMLSLGFVLMTKSVIKLPV